MTRYVNSSFAVICFAGCGQFRAVQLSLVLQIELLLASPMRRTLQTASLSFAPVLSRGLHVIAVPSAQEATDELSDVGSEVDVLRVWCEEHTKQVDLGFVTEGWEKKVGENACDVETLRARARKLREWIRGRKEAHVVLVSHGRFAHFMNGTVNDEGEQTDPWWIETEFRSFNFREDEGATIKETEESAEKRKQGDADAIQ